MEADRAPQVYRVSHVDGGGFVFLSRRHRVDHYDFAAAAPLRRALRSKFHPEGTQVSRDGFLIPFD
jgi:hypothetical protein